MERLEGIRRHGSWGKDTDESCKEEERDGKGINRGTGRDDKADCSEECVASYKLKSIIEEEMD